MIKGKSLFWVVLTLFLFIWLCVVADFTFAEPDEQDTKTDIKNISYAKKTKPELNKKFPDKKFKKTIIPKESKKIKKKRFPWLLALAVATSLSSYLIDTCCRGKPDPVTLISVSTIPEVQSMAILGVTSKVSVVDTGVVVIWCPPATLGGISKAARKALISSAVATAISLPSYLMETAFGGKLVPLTVTFVPTGPVEQDTLVQRWK